MYLQQCVELLTTNHCDRRCSQAVVEPWERDTGDCYTTRPRVVQ